MENVRMLQFRDITDTVLQKAAGHLVPLEAEDDIPFPVNRIYYIYGVDAFTRRGFHSHMDLEQVLIAAHGSVKVEVRTPYEKEIVTLDNPAQGLYIGPMVWREMFDFSEDAVLLVLASRHYDESDYYRDYSVYQQAARAYFNKPEQK